MYLRCRDNSPPAEPKFASETLRSISEFESHHPSQAVSLFRRKSRVHFQLAAPSVRASDELALPMGGGRIWN
jgi:hypothetical protein